MVIVMIAVALTILMRRPKSNIIFCKYDFQLLAFLETLINVCSLSMGTTTILNREMYGLIIVISFYILKIAMWCSYQSISTEYSN